MLLMAVCAVTALWAGNREKYTGSYNYQRALEAYGEGKYDDCQRYIDKELDENPENGYAHLMLAGVALENDDLSTALTSMGCCIKYLGDDTETLAKAHKLRKDMRLEMGDTIKALDDISESIKLCPLNDEYYGDRALLYRGMGQRDKAEADYRKVIELKKDSYEGYFGLSLTYCFAKRCYIIKV